MYSKDYWYGKEVEGRYCDIETVFVRAKIPDNWSSYPHIYFTIEYIGELAKDNSKFETELMQKIFDSNITISIEVNSATLHLISPKWLQRCHCIYRILDSNIQLLKKYDTISLDQGWYNVYQITKNNMQHIQPDDYKFDRTNN